MYNIGDKVEFTNKKAHDLDPYWYPEVGTEGVIARIEYTNKNGEVDILVQWKKGTTSDNDRWYVGEESIRLKKKYNQCFSEKH